MSESFLPSTSTLAAIIREVSVVTRTPVDYITAKIKPSRLEEILSPSGIPDPPLASAWECRTIRKSSLRAIKENLDPFYPPTDLPIPPDLWINYTVAAARYLRSMLEILDITIPDEVFERPNTPNRLRNTPERR